MCMYTLSVSMNVNSLTETVISVFARKTFIRGWCCTSLTKSKGQNFSTNKNGQNQSFWACENENPQETIVLMKHFRNLVCRTCNGNIILKNHPLDLFGDKAKVEKVLWDFESFFPVKMTQNDCLPLRICKPCLLKISKIKEFAKMVFEFKV